MLKALDFIAMLTARRTPLETREGDEVKWAELGHEKILHDGDIEALRVEEICDSGHVCW
jgi:hypothetical protein